MKITFVITTYSIIDLFQTKYLNPQETSSHVINYAPHICISMYHIIILLFILLKMVLKPLCRTSKNKIKRLLLIVLKPF